ncbi:hypothetical protein BT67DRAFT_315479 [Trichocladium antarcticum]|uniref:Uncharacterized protein n=1 Tax=Trichocladium antarcticum TaxID=1450529 RepID=A0AAN6UM89_9PEZI|nr:hypothetical protein BT67DRAFT_315479 [Trichocladium antarcticum]
MCHDGPARRRRCYYTSRAAKLHPSRTPRSQKPSFQRTTDPHPCFNLPWSDEGFVAGGGGGGGGGGWLMERSVSGTVKGKTGETTTARREEEAIWGRKQAHEARNSGMRRKQGLDFHVKDIVLYCKRRGALHVV